MKGLNVNIETFMVALIQNFRLDAHVVAVAKVMIDESGVVDFGGLMREVLASKKFDFLSKLQDGLDKCKVVVRLDDIENRRVYTYSEKLFRKTTDCFDDINFNCWNLDSDQMTRFLNVWFDENERKILKLIGDRHRLMFMNNNMRGALGEQINEIVTKLSLEKKKSALAIPMAQKSYIDSRVLKLIQGGKK
jgi:hypothetical protein